MATYDEVWTTMNDLSSQVANFLVVRDLIRDYNADEKVMDAAATLMDHFVGKFDDAFEKAWGVTIEAGKELDSLRLTTNIPDTIENE